MKSPHSDCCEPGCCDPSEKPLEPGTLRDIVREKYGEAALQARSGKSACCESTCCGGGGKESAPNPITSNLYDDLDKAQLPEAAVLASLGCGNPTALAELRPGETVLDLGSGGGIDVLLSARRVGPSGKAFGLDMTDEMLALAQDNLGKSGLTNVVFLKGEIEKIPLPANSVDVILSNCVINLSADKSAVFREAFRVLKPGGRLAISDVVVREPVPAPIRKSMELWIGCIAGALEEKDYREKLREAGFQDITFQPTRVYRAEDARDLFSGAGIDLERIAAEVDGKIASEFVRARKPG